MIVDREAERDWLRSRLASPDRQLLVCYGRRRIGKTTLVSHVLETADTPTLYYLCDQRGHQSNARQFATHAATALEDVSPAVDDFLDAFRYLATRIDGPFVVALDEFTYLVEADETVPSVFQTIVDDVLDGTDISLILLGSSISMMEEGVLSYESPLYGRRTGQWRLEPMTLGEAAGFFPAYDAVDLIRTYSVLGGVPAYLDQFDPETALLDNIDTRILSKGAFLYEEPEFLLRQELREPATYLAILEAIAGGATTVTTIANEIDTTASSLSRYLQNLRQLAIIDRESPVTDPDGRGVYDLADSFLRFWFRYVAPNRSTLEQGHTEPVRESIEATFPTHVSWTFETVCRQAVEMPAFPVACSRVGRWWYDEQEIDVVGLNEESAQLLLGECKWTAKPVAHSLLDSLETIAPEVRWRGADRSITYALFSKAGFTDRLRTEAAERDDLFLFTPDDVLELVST